MWGGLTTARGHQWATTTGSIPTRNGGSNVLHITKFCNRLHGINLTAFLDPLSYKKSSKYRICILGIVRNLQFSYWYNPTPHPWHFLGSFCGLHVTNNRLSCLRKAPSVIISNFSVRENMQPEVGLLSLPGHHPTKKKILFAFGQCRRKRSSFHIKHTKMNSSILYE